MPPELTPLEIYVMKTEITASRMEDWLITYASIPSRDAEHSGNRYAVKTLLDDLKRIGGPHMASAESSRFALDGHVLPNVEAVLPGTGLDDTIVIVSAHFDSTAEGTSPHEPLIHPAPGADDDAGGIAAVLMAAQAAVQLVEVAATPVPRREIRFLFFNAEEMKQAGSHAYAAEARAEDEKIAGVFQMDMIGYAPTDPSTFTIFAGAPSSGLQYASVELAKRVAAMCPVVSPAITARIVEDDGRHPGDSSDHVSFHQMEYPACLVTEGEENPARHTVKDVPANLNHTYAANIARAVAAAAWHMATR